MLCKIILLKHLFHKFLHKRIDVSWTNLFLCVFNLVDVPDYCAVHPADILPAPDNCAHYYNCSAVNAALPPRMISRKLVSGVLDAHEMECTYPDLFDVSSRSCKNFTTVTCKSRPEPPAPCNYKTVLYTLRMCITICVLAEILL